ncbi:TetR/AcrR family transcriptional regulator [Sporichthya polymorpha]|uniref:TetR/AcrR family transcriptional regulator n=1 Tax=Sporichthya polymorpha TaxID=35751 RepID=UPI0003670E40|nr:TetR/AcrR family transcriptional regulator [Sporichthya polymorpha]
MSAPHAAPLGRRQRNNAERRARLLAEARALFDAQGIEATTIEQIAAAADLSTRTLYNFFPTKTDLVAALLSDEIQDRLRTGIPSGRSAHRSPVSGVFAVVEAMVEVMGSASKAEQQMVLAGALLADGDNEARRYVRSIDVFLTDLLRDRLAQHADALRPDLDPDETAGLIFSLLNGLYIGWLRGEGELTEILPTVRRYLQVLLGPPASASRSR